MYIKNNFPLKQSRPFSNKTWVRTRDGINNDNQKFYSEYNTSKNVASSKNHNEIIDNMTIFDFQESPVTSKESKKTIADECQMHFIEESKCTFTGMKIGDDRILLFIFYELVQYSLISGSVKGLDQSKPFFNYIG